MARRKSYFPSVDNIPYGATTSGGVTTLNPQDNPAYLAAVAGGGTYKSRRDDFRNRYPQFANTPAQQNLQQFDLSQAYQKGYGEPSPAIQSSPSGTYQVQGGVAAPTGPTNPVASFFSGVNNLFSGASRGLANIGISTSNTFSDALNRMNNTFSQANNTIGNPNQVAYNPPPQPRRYFDPNYNYNY